MKRFLALLLVTLMLGTAFAEPTVSEIPVELNMPATDADGSEIEESAEALGEVFLGQEITESNTTVKVSLEELEAQAESLEQAGKLEEARALRAQIQQYTSAEQAGSTVGGSVSVQLPGAVIMGIKEDLKLAAPGATFKSASPKIVTVDGTGKLVGKKTGSTKVSVTLPGSNPVQIKVTVKKKPSKVTLSRKSLVLCLDETVTLKAKLPSKTASTITWSSSAPGIATVDASGKITPVKEGKTTITARTYNGKKATCKVTVLNGKAPGKLSVPSTLSVEPKGKVTLQPSVNGGAATVYSFSVKNKKIATVNSQGVVTGKKKGTTKITVKTHNGLSATVKVTVAKKTITELTDLTGMDMYKAVTKMGGKKSSIGQDGKDGTGYWVFKKNGYTISGPYTKSYKSHKYYRKVNWIVLEKRNKYTVLGAKPGDTSAAAVQKLKAAGFENVNVSSYGELYGYTDNASISGWVQGGKIQWLQYSAW